MFPIRNKALVHASKAVSNTCIAAVTAVNIFAASLTSLQHQFPIHFLICVDKYPRSSCKFSSFSLSSATFLLGGGCQNGQNSLAHVWPAPHVAIGIDPIACSAFFFSYAYNEGIDEFRH